MKYKMQPTDQICYSAGCNNYAIEAINDILNPAVRLAAQLDEIKDTLIRLVNDRGISGSPQ